MDGRENRRTSNRQQNVLHRGEPIPLVCITERESNVVRLVVDQLEQEGFQVQRLSMGTNVIRLVERHQPSLVIIAAATSRGRDLELCRGIRRVQSLARTPIIILGANASEEDRVLGLESGADDYITDSSSRREVVARVRAVMRRSARQEPQPWMPRQGPPLPYHSKETLSPKIMMGDIAIDPNAMRISVRGSEVEITNLEFRLLYYLAHNQGRVFSRDQLLDAVWGTPNVELRSVDACVRRLRRKIEPDPTHPVHLRTVRGAGYCLQIASELDPS